MDENNILTGSNSNDEPPPCYTEVVGRVPGEHIDTSSIPACSSKESDERSHADTAGIEDNNKSYLTGTNIDCDNKTTPEANQENPNPTYNKPKAVLKRTPSVPIESIAVPKVNCPEKIVRWSCLCFQLDVWNFVYCIQEQFLEAMINWIVWEYSKVDLPYKA